MIINTRSIREGHSVLSQSIRDLGERPDWPSFADTLECRYEIDRTGPEIRVAVSFSGTVILECARCLKSFGTPVEGAATVILRRGEPGGKRDPDDEFADFVFDDRHEEVDLAPAVYDEVMISLPLKPLCSEDCAGIEVPGGIVGGHTEAGARDVDPRWNALRKLAERNRS